MSKRNFELFMCCLGNGITVCNKAAKQQREEFLIFWNKYTVEEKYYKLLDTCNTADFIDICKDKSSMTEKVKKLESKYLNEYY